MDFIYKPHFYAHLLASFCLLVAVILLAINYKKIFKLDGIELVKIFSVLAIAVAAHGQGHTTLEKEYGFNPFKYFF